MLGNTETEGASHHYVNNVIEIPRFKQKNYVSGQTKKIKVPENKIKQSGCLHISLQQHTKSRVS